MFFGNMQKLSLVAEKRNILGRKVKALRRDGKLPANIYGKGFKSLAISVDLSDFEKIYAMAGETSIVDVKVGSSKNPVLIHNVQLHPVTDLPIHADFHKINLKEKVKAAVPIEMIGESPAVKQGLGTVVLQIKELEVEALPTDLPDKFKVDLSKLDEVGNAILVKDISIDDKKVKIDIKGDEIVAKVEPLMEEEEDAPTVVEEEAEEGEGSEAEGTEDDKVEQQDAKETKDTTSDKEDGDSSKAEGGKLKSK